MPITVTVPAQEYFDDSKSEFVENPGFELVLEHSLASLSKWESKLEKPFLSPDKKTTEETLTYIECMCLTPGIPSEVFSRLSNENIEQINNYIGAKMSATWFNERKQAPGRREIITAEIIYYWMISLQIPMDWETRHLNQLMTLIKVCNQKNAPKQKPRPQHEMIAERNRLNAERKAQMKTQG